MVKVTGCCCTVPVVGSCVASPRVSILSSLLSSFIFLIFIIESTANGAVEIMSENSLTFLPLDDPEPKVAKHVIEKGYDGSEKTAVKGQCWPFVNLEESSSIT